MKWALKSLLNGVRVDKDCWPILSDRQSGTCSTILAAPDRVSATGTHGNLTASRAEMLPPLGQWALSFAHQSEADFFRR